MRATRPFARVALGLTTSLALAGSIGCAAALRQPGVQDAQAAATRWPGTTLTDLERGRSLYVRRCSSCHTLHLPSERAAGEWPGLVEKMSRKARLTPEQQLDITRFVVALAPSGER